MNPNTIPVFYHPAMSVEGNPSFSPSAGKPRAVVEDWQAHKLPIELIAFTPASDERIALAHDPAYVLGVMVGTVPNGFGNTSPEVAESLRYTVGSMVAAAKHAIERHAVHANYGIACSPTSGFHHARRASAHGYCTFNGLVVTALALKQLRLVERVAIIDCDYHYGDGTAALIEGLDWIDHYSLGQHYHSSEDAPAALAYTERAIRKAQSCDLVLYQAGADAHIDDPLGGIFTTEQMRLRDFEVFRWACALERPLVWNLAGGYQRDAAGTIEPVLALHRNTMRECIERYAPGATP